jgi:hypothetical protein
VRPLPALPTSLMHIHPTRAHRDQGYLATYSTPALPNAVESSNAACQALIRLRAAWAVR